MGPARGDSPTNRPAGSGIGQHLFDAQAWTERHTINAEDVEAEIPPELELAEALAAHPRLDGEDHEAV
jgi:hypothetical protein